MRRQFVAQAAKRRGAFGCLLAQVGHFALQPIYLLLLADDNLVELFQQIIRKAGFDFQLLQAAFDVLHGFHGGY